MTQIPVTGRSSVILTLEYLLIAAIIGGVSLRLGRLGSREYWYDEVLSLLYATGQRNAYRAPGDTPVALRNYTILLSLPPESSGHDTLRTIRGLFRGFQKEPHPPLFYISLHLWLRLFGNGELATRSLVALFGIGAIGGAYGLGRVVLGHRGGLLLAALLCTNPYASFHSWNLRMYAPLVMWATLSGWALLHLIHRQGDGVTGNRVRRISWSLFLAGSVGAGLLTQYLFTYWIIALAAVALYLDRRRWWQHVLWLAAGVSATIPWGLWGTLRQLRNAAFIFDRLGDKHGEPSWLRHLHDVATVLGSHLLVGDWRPTLPLLMVVTGGIIVSLVLAACALNLWRQGERRLLGVACLLGIFPLLLALGVDVVWNKFAVGWGGGRAVVFILPGCLLLLALWIERGSGPWYRTAAAVLLLAYLGITAADVGLRHRRMFRIVAEVIDQAPETPTLVAMNSQAWGHVLRLAYYTPVTAQVMLLAQQSAKLIPALERTLHAEAGGYPRIVWLESGYPGWSPPATESQRQQIHQILAADYRLVKSQPLSGTSKGDHFTIHLYERAPSKAGSL